jgi:hypothetical protein
MTQRLKDLAVRVDRRFLFCMTGPSLSKYTNLLTWARSNGAVIPSSLIFSAEPYGHCRSSEPIPAGTALFHIPHSLVITPAVATAAIPQLEEVAGHVRICTFLAEQRGRNGFWKEYLETLPEKFYTPPYFNDRELEYLKGTNLWFAWRDRMELWKREYESIRDIVPTVEWYGIPYSS